jgi:hypothetical protein
MTFVDRASPSTIASHTDVHGLAVGAKVRRTRAQRMRSRTNLSRAARVCRSSTRSKRSLEPSVRAAPSFPSIEIPIDVDEPEPVALEVSIARQSESAIWEGLDGEVGVFLATYDELPIGTEVTLTVHLTGERPFETRARVVWLRNAPGLWPGLGLRLHENRPDVWFRIQRFSQRWRAPMFQ